MEADTLGTPSVWLDTGSRSTSGLWLLAEGITPVHATYAITR
jgi:hypothetical protein